MARKARTQKAAPAAPPAAPPAATETIDGVTYTGLTDEGRARLRANHWYHAPSIGRVASGRAPTAHRDKSPEAWAKRVGAQLAKKGGDALPGQPSVNEQQVGKDAGAGYVIIATDGHRALCKRGTPDKPSEKKIAEMTSTRQWFDVTPDLAPALLRMKAAGPAKLPSTTLALDPKAKRLTLSTRDPEDGTEATEWMPLTPRSRTKTVAVPVNTIYLLDALGLPDLRIYPGTGETPVMFDTADGEYRLLVMPMRVGAKAAAESTVDADDAVAPVVAPAAPPVEEVPVATEVASVSATEAPPAATSPDPEPRAPSPEPDEVLTPGQKAWRTRQQRIASGEAKPTDWKSAGQKAWETRMRNKRTAA